MSRISDEELHDLIEQYESGLITLDRQQSGALDLMLDLQESRAEMTLLGKEVQMYSEYKEAFYKEGQIKLERDKYKSALERISARTPTAFSSQPAWFIAQEALKDG